MLPEVGHWLKSRNHFAYGNLDSSAIYSHYFMNDVTF